LEEKERKKMTHLKLTTLYQQAQAIQHAFCLPIEAVIDVEATNPYPVLDDGSTSVVALLGVYVISRGGANC
jgi:hypothetical protein